MLKQVLASSETGLKGVEECEFILKKFASLRKTEMPDLFDDKTNQIELDLTLARGLNYYTGAIFEVKALDVQIGSITGGGRRYHFPGSGYVRVRMSDRNARISFLRCSSLIKR